MFLGLFLHIIYKSAMKLNKDWIIDFPAIFSINQSCLAIVTIEPKLKVILFFYSFTLPSQIWSYQFIHCSISAHVPDGASLRHTVTLIGR